MNNRLKNIKEELNMAISPTAFFTEEDKRAIRRKIQGGNVPKSKRNTVFPMVMSVAAALVFFLLIGGFLGDKLDLTSKDSRNTENKGAIETPVAVKYAFDPKLLQKGAQLGGFTVKSISPSARYFPESSFQALFTGSITLEGRFHLEEDDLRFYPDKNSAAENLPVTEGPQRLPTISIANYMENKDKIADLLKITTEADVIGTATFSFYRMDFRPSGEQVDSADLSAVNGTELGMKQSGNTGVVDEIPLTFQIIPEKLQPIYEEFYKTGNDKVLQGLPAEDIFLMFWQAYDFNHTVMIYELLEEGSEGRSYQKFIDNGYERGTKSLQVEFEKIKENHKNLTIQIDGERASISAPDSQAFVLKKDESGIWKFEYFFK